MNHILGLSIASSTLLLPGPREHRAGPCLCEHPTDLLLWSKCLQSAFGREKLWGTARGVREKQGNCLSAPLCQRHPEHSQSWVSLLRLAREHTQPVGRGLQRAWGWGGLDLLCIIAPNTWGLGGS